MYWFIHVIMLLILIAMPYKSRRSSPASSATDAAAPASRDAAAPVDDVKRAADQLVLNAVNQAVKKVSKEKLTTARDVSDDATTSTAAANDGEPLPPEEESKLFHRICAQMPENSESS